MMSYTTAIQSISLVEHDTMQVPACHGNRPPRNPLLCWALFVCRPRHSRCLIIKVVAQRISVIIIYRHYTVSQGHCGLTGS